MHSATTFYLVRHGQTQSNLDHLISGQTQTPLSDTGRQEAKETAKKLEGVQFDVVASSDLARAVETAQILVGPDVAIQQYPELRERGWGELEGEPHDTLQPYLEAHKKLSAKEQWQKPLRADIESDASIYERVAKCLRQLATEHPGKTVLVSTHGGPIRLVLIGLGLRTSEQLPLGSFKHGGYVQLQYNDSKFGLVKIAGADEGHISSE